MSAEPDLARAVEAFHGRIIRVCVDLNVWVAELLALRHGRVGTASRICAGAVREGRSAMGDLHLVVSWGMLTRLREVLERKLAIPRHDVDYHVQGIVQTACVGTLGAPLVALGGTGAMPGRDAEDAHVVDVAIAGHADVIVTGNFADFVSYRTEVVEPGRVAVVAHAGGAGRDRTSGGGAVARGVTASTCRLAERLVRGHSRAVCRRCGPLTGVCSCWPEHCGFKPLRGLGGRVRENATVPSGPHAGGWRPGADRCPRRALGMLRGARGRRPRYCSGACSSGRLGVTGRPQCPWEPVRLGPAEVELESDGLVVRGLSLPRSNGRVVTPLGPCA